MKKPVWLRRYLIAFLMIVQVRNAFQFDKSYCKVRYNKLR
jgi:hypothetical protein